MVVYSDDQFVGAVDDSRYYGSWLTNAIDSVKGVIPAGTDISVATPGGTVGLTNQGLSFNTPHAMGPQAPHGIEQILRENWMLLAGAAVVLMLLLRKK